MMHNDSAGKPGVEGYQLLHETLSEWGITRFIGVTGGGVIHFLKDLPPLVNLDSATPAFFSIAEYVAGFVPLGYYLACGKSAAALATTGAATKLLACGLSDAKLHDIPAVYIVPLSGESSRGMAPLQDTSEYGSHTVARLQAELPNSVFVLDAPEAMESKLHAARAELNKSRPVVLVLLHSALCKPALVQGKAHAVVSTAIKIPNVVDEFRQAVHGRRLVILVGEEMARHANAPALVGKLSSQFRAAVIWSINGANAVRRDNPYGYGYVSFGGNDEALRIYQSLGERDVLLVLGACCDEYTVNLKKSSAAKTFFFSSLVDGYGQIDHSFVHMANGPARHVHGPLNALVQQLCDAASKKPFENIPFVPAPACLNHRKVAPPGAGFVDMQALYHRLDQWWPAHSVGFDDVCLAYKDRQYVTQRANDHIRFYSLYRGSAMGGALGAAVGARLALPNQPIFIFTGDGCFRLVAGALAEASELGLVMFLLNNGSFSIVGQGLPKILPGVEQKYYHASLSPLDYSVVAQACGWAAERLAPDLGNLDALLAKIEVGAYARQSLLIDIPVDPQQVLGLNPRVANL
ncbi:thiamine pyrophosphate-dependent enzyme [Pseudomonas putida]